VIEYKAISLLLCGILFLKSPAILSVYRMVRVRAIYC
jgi:hypothetical protein